MTNLVQLVDEAARPEALATKWVGEDESGAWNLRNYRDGEGVLRGNGESLVRSQGLACKAGERSDGGGIGSPDEIRCGHNELQMFKTEM